jgi:hypothetical protein
MIGEMISVRIGRAVNKHLLQGYLPFHLLLLLPEQSGLKSAYMIGAIEATKPRQSGMVGVAD